MLKSLCHSSTHVLHSSDGHEQLGMLLSLSQSLSLSQKVALVYGNMLPAAAGWRVLRGRWR
jgi:hypothetical protein